MLQFSPRSSRLWQQAAFSLIYSSTLGVIIRLSIFVLLLTTILLLLTSGSENLPFFIFSLLGIFLMFELFYRFNLLKTKPSKEVSKVSAETNLADLTTFNLARLLLAHPNWGSVGGLLKALTKDKKVRFVAAKAGFNTVDFRDVFAKEEPANLDSLMQFSHSLAEKEGHKYIDELTLLGAIFSSSEDLKGLLFKKELKQNDLDNILHWARDFYKDDLEKLPFWQRPTSSLGLGLASVWMGVGL